MQAADGLGARSNELVTAVAPQSQAHHGPVRLDGLDTGGVEGGEANRDGVVPVGLVWNGLSRPPKDFLSKGF